MIRNSSYSIFVSRRFCSASTPTASPETMGAMTRATNRPDIDHPVVEISGVQFLRVTESQCVEYVVSRVISKLGIHLVTFNVDILRRYELSQDYKDTLGEDFSAVADGMPIVWTSTIMGNSLPERVTGSSLLYSLSEAASHNGIRTLLLGGADDSGRRACRALERQSPNLSAQWIPLPYPFLFDKAECAALEEQIRQFSPGLVFVSLGSPRAERLVATIRASAPAACWISVGAAFDFAAGVTTRADHFTQRLGLEWQHRLLATRDALPTDT